MLRVIEYFAKSLKVTQGHSKWHHSKALVRFPVHMTSDRIFGRVWDTQQQRSKNALTLKHMFRVVQGHWIWRSSIDIHHFRLVGHCNYSSILYHLRDKARYWSKIAFFVTPAFGAPFMTWRVGILPYRLVAYGKTRMVWLPDGGKRLKMFSRFVRRPTSDGRTGRHLTIA